MNHPIRTEAARHMPGLGRAVLAAVAVLGLGVTLALWAWVGRIAEMRAASEVAGIAERQAGLIQRRFADSLLPVSSLAVFHATHEDADEGVFRLVAEAANRLGVPAARLGWEPRVGREERAAHEAAAQRAGLAGYRIVTFGAGGAFVPAPEKDEYFPIRYEVLAPGFPSALGFDVSSTPDRRVHVEHARHTRQPVGVLPDTRQTLLRETAFMIIFWPVFAAEGNAVPGSPDGLRGYVTSLIRLTDLWRYVVQGLPPERGRLVLRAQPWNSDASIAIGSHTHAAGFLPGPPDDPAPDALRRSFPALGITWHLDYEPDPADGAGWRARVALYVFAGGIGVTLAMLAFVYVLIRQVSLERALRAVSLGALEQQIGRAREVEALNEQLREKEQLARKAALVRTRLLASASHDVRQPLQAMMVHVGLLEMRAQDEATARAVQGLKNVAASLTGMFGVFLDLHRLDEDKVAVQRGYVDVAALLRALCDEFALEAGRKGIALRLRAGDCAAWTDRAVLELILRNLIGNAVKFTRSGAVLVAVRQRRALEIQVWDTGPGIAPEAVGLVFEEFAQVAQDRSGAGLGLSIAQRMAGLLGGRIELCSRVGRGSRFTLALPRDEAAQAAPDEAGAA